MSDDYVISNEIDLGSLGVDKSNQSVDTGVSGIVPVSEEQVETDESVSPATQSNVSEEEAAQVITSSPVISSQKTVATTADVSIRDLEMVEAAFVGGCQTLQSIIEKTGLSSAVVTICLKHLEKTRPVSSGGSFYCTSDNLVSLQKKLSTCINCK